VVALSSLASSRQCYERLAGKPCLGDQLGCVGLAELRAAFITRDLQLIALADRYSRFRFVPTWGQSSATLPIDPDPGALA
jgi:hypothetical protein